MFSIPRILVNAFFALRALRRLTSYAGTEEKQCTKHGKKVIMYKKTFEIELELTEENYKKLHECYTEIVEEWDGMYDSFEDWIEDRIYFRLLRHIFANAEIELTTIMHYNCQQT